NANLDEVTFSFDGRDLWVIVQDSEYAPVHIRGVFDGASYVRPGATTLTALDFLDGALSISVVAATVASEAAATVGTVGDDVLAGRDGQRDYFYGGAGHDTYVITADSGSDTIRRDVYTQAQIDTIHFDYNDDRVFQRDDPQAQDWHDDEA